MTESEVWSIRRLLAWTVEFFKKKGFDAPRLEAEVLLAHACGWERIKLYVAYDEEPAEEVRTRFRALVKQRAEGRPTAYLTGKKEFYSLEFAVDPHVLIPRPETEELIVGVLDYAKARPGDGVLEMVDLGTGSGAIAVTCAKHAPRLRCLAVDKSPGALEVARRNAATHGVAERVAFLRSDWFAAVPAEQRFDIVASNPPYVRDDEMAGLPRDVRDFEPESALKAGPLGMDCYDALIPQAAARLVPGGLLILEIGPAVEAAVVARVAATPGLRFLRVVPDAARRPRVVHAVRT